MSDLHKPVTGLGEDKFDPDLHKGTIDHDFFDNCANFKSDEDRKSPSNGLNRDDTCPSAAISEETVSHGNSTGSDYANTIPRDIKTPTNSDTTVETGPETQGCTTSFSIERNQESFFGPLTCEIPQQPYQNGIFSTGKLLACLTQPELTIEVDLDSNKGGNNSVLSNGSSNSSDLLQTFVKRHQQDQNLLHVHSNGSMRRMMMRNSAASDTDSSNGFNGHSDYHDEDDYDDSNSDDSSSDDEEFIQMLEKYYDLIDAEESDYSDITEVSPMSSVTASPLPSYPEDSNSGLPNGSSSQPDSIEPVLSHAEEPEEPRDHCSNEGNGPHVLVAPRLCLVAPSDGGLINNNLESIIVTTSGNISEASSNDLDGMGTSSGCSCDEEGLSRMSSMYDQGDKPQQPYTEHNGSSSSLPSSSNSARAGSSRAFKERHQLAVGSNHGSCHRTNGHRRRNMNITLDQIRRIQRDNSALYHKIVDHQKGHHHHHSHHGHHVRAGIHSHRSGNSGGARTLPSSASITRLRQHRRIEHENLVRAFVI